MELVFPFSLLVWKSQLTEIAPLRMTSEDCKSYPPSGSFNAINSSDSWATLNALFATGRPYSRRNVYHSRGAFRLRRKHARNRSVKEGSIGCPRVIDVPGRVERAHTYEASRTISDGARDRRSLSYKALSNLPQIAKWCVAPELLAELRPLSEVRSPYWCRWTQPVSANVSHVLASQRSPSLSLLPPPLPFSSSFVGSSSLPPSLLRDAARSSSCASVRLFVFSSLSLSLTCTRALSLFPPSPLSLLSLSPSFVLRRPRPGGGLLQGSPLVSRVGPDTYIMPRRRYTHGCEKRRDRGHAPDRPRGRRPREGDRVKECGGLPESNESLGRACCSMQPPLVRTGG